MSYESLSKETRNKRSEFAILQKEGPPKRDIEKKSSITKKGTIRVSTGGERDKLRKTTGSIKKTGKIEVAIDSEEANGQASPKSPSPKTLKGESAIPLTLGNTNIQLQEIKEINKDKSRKGTVVDKGENFKKEKGKEGIKDKGKGALKDKGKENTKKESQIIIQKDRSQSTKKDKKTEI